MTKIANRPTVEAESDFNKRQAFDEMVKSGIEPKKARAMAGISWSYYYNHCSKALPEKADQYNPKNLASKAHKVLDRIITGKIACKPGELLTACKMVLDRSHPINEPVAPQSQQFIQINVGRLQEAVNAINAMSMPIVDVTPTKTILPEIQIPKS